MQLWLPLHSLWPCPGLLLIWERIVGCGPWAVGPGPSCQGCQARQSPRCGVDPRDTAQAVGPARRLLQRNPAPSAGWTHCCPGPQSVAPAPPTPQNRLCSSSSRPERTSGPDLKPQRPALRCRAQDTHHHHCCSGSHSCHLRLEEHICQWNASAGVLDWVMRPPGCGARTPGAPAPGPRAGLALQSAQGDAQLRPHSTPRHLRWREPPWLAGRPSALVICPAEGSRAVSLSGQPRCGSVPG